MNTSFFAADETAMEQLGVKLLASMAHQGVIHLVGDLGMGKTTLSRGILRAAGHQGAVKSPTYTLVEPYELAAGMIYHFDLYRLQDPEELEFLGIRDYFSEDSLCLVEWPDKGEGLLPAPDLVITIEREGDGRRIHWQANTAKGQQAVDNLNS